MTDLPRRFAVLLALPILVLAACAGGAAPSAPATTGSEGASPATSAAASDVAGSSETAPGPSGTTVAASEAPLASDPGASAAGAGSIPPGTPTGCIGLGAEDCERARALAATVLNATDPAVVYVQVGPFGCVAGEQCPPNLLTRPEGDVVIEFGGGTGINVHLKVAHDGAFEATRGEAMGVAVPPASPPEGLAGPRPFELGHCGVFSGIDVDGSYWDLVGPISFDSGEAINQTTGTISLTDRDRATFTAPGGFSVQLIRHAGPKLLPLCM